MSVIKRRQFLRSTLATVPAAFLPYGRVFAATAASNVNDVEAIMSLHRVLERRRRTLTR